MCKGNDFILIRSGLEGDFFLEHEILYVFLNAHGFLLLYAHGSHGSHGFCLRHFEHEIFFEHLILFEHESHE